MHPDTSTIETKLSAARTRLILEKPFLGALVLRLPLKEAKADWCPTTATDARSFYYNPEYIDALSLAETQFMLAHDALHCALSHFARRGHRLKHRWDLACDLAINPLLIDDGLKPPPDILMIEDYKGLTAEEIYPLIDDLEDSETVDTHAYDGEESQPGGDAERNREREKEMLQQPQPTSDPEQGESGENTIQLEDASEAPTPLAPDEKETLSILWQQRMAGAAQQAMQAGKLGGALARMIDHLLQPQLPWRMLLARYLSNTARDDYSYMRPSRREGEYILPSLRSHQVDLVVALDTSGSVKEHEFSEFLAEINAIMGQLRARITLLACDAELAEGSPWTFEPWEEFRLPSTFTGGGGTSFNPVFEWVEKQGAQPETLVYFTDAEGKFPHNPPTYPVIWLIKGKRPVPWGQRIQLN
jgi:predicted metal-dependent peptidase